MDECVFCQIVGGRVPAYKIWEDRNFLAVLDRFPKISGQVVLISKKHVPSYVFSLPPKAQRGFFLAAAKVAGRMDEKLGTGRTAMLLEGLELDHAHLKLYPVYSNEEYVRDMQKKVGQKMKDEELKIIAEKFWRGGED